MFQYLNTFPKELLTCQPGEVEAILTKPTLFHFKGAKKPAVYLGGFIHGNEITGFLVLQELLNRYGEDLWPRDTYFFIGNVWAATQNKRRLDGQPDYNRIWREGDLAENKMAMDIVKKIDPSTLFAAIDIHNTCGNNPHYVIVESLGPQHLNLAALFGSNCLYFSEPEYTCSETLGKYCPAVTLEAGYSGSPEGVAHTLEFINEVLKRDELPNIAPANLDLNILESLATVKVAPESSVGVVGEDADICFVADIEKYNFQPVPVGTLFGRYRGNHRLKVYDDQKNEVTDLYFTHKDGKILSRLPFVPTMLKLDKHVIKTNCMAYLMRQIALPAH